jgi:signal transduction histidine kinase
MTERETISLAFDVDAALLVELGERLVARRSIALAELIKNAYDADATEVIVSFEDVAGPNGAIVVLDDGSGMSLEAMRRGWMRIATNDATLNARSAKFGRPRTGAKGVGRFACGRLASRLSLESISDVSGSLERVTAEFDWHDFEPGRDLADVMARVTRESLAKRLPTGTTLRLSGLTDIWAQKDLAELQAELSDLMNLDEIGGYVRRIGDYEPDPGFEAQILAPEFPRFEGAIGDPFLESAWGVLKGSVTERGEPRYELQTLDSDSRLWHQPGESRCPDLLGATFTIRMMVYQGGRFRGSGYSLAEARDLGRKRGGVRIYLDGFQVFSYGSPGDDWLDLDQDRARRRSTLDDPLLEKQASGLPRPMLMLPGNMQLFGAVSLARDRNPGVTVSISRERLVQNDTYEQLKRFVRSGIDWMTVCYARDLERREPRGTDTKEERQTSAEAVRSVREAVKGETAIPEDVKQEVVTSLDEAETILTQEVEAHVSELSMLRVLGSAGTTLMVFDHTLRAMAGQLDGIVARLESTVDHVPPEHMDAVRQTLDDLRSWSSMATGQGSLVGLLVGPEARTRRRSLALRPLVDALSRGFSGYLSRFGISLENDVPPAVRTPPLHEAEVYAVLLNLVTNSFKAVREGAERRVRVVATTTSEGFTLEVSDTGIGIPLQNRENVFQPFFTTSQPDPVLGIGTGLGLKIVRDLARAWGGDAEFVEPAEPWHTTIELVVPNRGRV